MLLWQHQCGVQTSSRLPSWKRRNKSERTGLTFPLAPSPPIPLTSPDELGQQPPLGRITPLVMRSDGHSATKFELLHLKQCDRRSRHWDLLKRGRRGLHDTPVQPRSNNKSTEFLSSQQVHDNVTLLPRQRRPSAAGAGEDCTARIDDLETQRSRARMGMMQETRRHENGNKQGMKGDVDSLHLRMGDGRRMQEISHQDGGRRWFKMRKKSVKRM